jgi:hypothetical protein
MQTVEDCETFFSDENLSPIKVPVNRGKTVEEIKNIKPKEEIEKKL